MKLLDNYYLFLLIFCLFLLLFFDFSTSNAYSFELNSSFSTTVTPSFYLNTQTLYSNNFAEILDDANPETLIYETDTNKKKNNIWVANSFLGGGFLAYLIYGYFVFWQDAEYHKFIISDWDNTYQRTYSGGSDKISHAWGGYLITRSCAKLYTWAGMNHYKATWTGFSLAQLFLFLGEIEDGFTIDYGFDPVDVAANISGGLLGVLEELNPTFDSWFDFRISYWPSNEFKHKSNFNNVAEDYSGLSFYWVLTFSAIKPSPYMNWLRFFEIYLGYHTEGFMPGYDYQSASKRPGYIPFNRKRYILIGISVNLMECLDRFYFHNNTNSAVRNAWNSFFDIYQHPISGDIEIEISKDEWYHPKF